MFNNFAKEIHLQRLRPKHRTFSQQRQRSVAMFEASILAPNAYKISFFTPASKSVEHAGEFGAMFAQKTARTIVHGILHVPDEVPQEPAMVIAVGGVGGGTHGPAHVYGDLGDTLAKDHKTMTFRLDFQDTNELDTCVGDVLYTIDTFCGEKTTASKATRRSEDPNRDEVQNEQEPVALASREILEEAPIAQRWTGRVRKVGLLGWSFGGAVVIRAGVKEKERVKAVATVASQGYGTDDVAKLAPTPI
ncbi:hypothetical protein HK102_003021, partial [Quaeritorhiza haematococci]